VYEGENYALSGNTVTPDADFTGELSVPVSVGDGVNDSNVFGLAVIVAVRADGVKQITGTVTTDTGEPAAGVTVVARNPDIGGEDITAVTDADGKYTLQVSGGGWEVQVMQDNTADWFAPDSETVTFANDNPSDRRCASDRNRDRGRCCCRRRECDSQGPQPRDRADPGLSSG